MNLVWWPFSWWVPGDLLVEAKHLEIQGRLENPKRKIVGASLLARLQGSSLPPPCVSDVSSKWFAHFLRIRTKNIHPKNIHPVSRMSPLSGLRTFLGSDQKIFIFNTKPPSSVLSADIIFGWVSCGVFGQMFACIWSSDRNNTSSLQWILLIALHTRDRHNWRLSMMIKNA